MALAARPGRVDQTIEIPLPNAESRRRLLKLYGAGLDLGGVDLVGWSRRSDRVTPAFIAEWFRKAALMAAERGEAVDDSSPPLRLTDEDLERLLEELVMFGGRLTQELLGDRAYPGWDFQTQREDKPASTPKPTGPTDDRCLAAMPV